MAELKPQQFAGRWSYRAFYNDPDLDKPFNELRFATALLTLHPFAESGAESDAMRGTLRGVGWGTWIDWQLELTGACSGDSLLMRGTNQIEGEPWVYDYHARLVRTWPQAVDARPVLTGSVVRTQGRQRHDAVAGVHATFIAIKHDAAP